MSQAESKRPEDMEDLIQALSGPVHELQQLARRAAAEYKSVVDGILQSQCRDVQQIERTLDGLLNFAFETEVLVQFKRPRRYATVHVVAKKAGAWA